MAHVVRRSFCMPQAGKQGTVIPGAYRKAKKLRLADNQTSDREPFRFPFRQKQKVENVVCCLCGKGRCEN